jgi:hypothetical protein
MEVEMTRDQVIELLNTDINFAIEFILWNNPDELYAMYESITHKPLPSDQDLKDYLIQGIENRDQNVIQIISIPYISNAPNWTAGFDSYFKGDMNFMDPNNGPSKAINWGNFLGTIGAITSALGGAIDANNQPPVPPLTPEQQLAAEQAKAEADRKKAADERKSKIITWSVIGGFIILLATLAVIYFSANKEEEKQAKKAA